MMRKLQKSIGILLQKSEGKFEHGKIKRLRVQQEHAKLKKLEESFDEIHQAYLDCIDVAEDEPGESALLEKEDEHYEEVIDKLYETLQLYADYQEDYKIFKAAQPDPNLAKKEAEEKSTKETLVKQLKDEEAFQKQEAEAAKKAEDERIKKGLRAKVLQSELLFKESVGMFRTAKKCAEDMTRFAKELSREEVVSQVRQFAHVRSLPTYETKNKLLDRLGAATEAAAKYRDAIEAHSGVDDAMTTVTFDRVAEDESVQDIVSLLDLLLNAKVEYNGRGSVGSQSVAAKSTPIKVRLNTPKFSGKSRDFAIYKKEFMDVIVPGRSNPEIGALLREGLNTKEKNLLRNNEMADYMEALDILQNEYGKADLVISDVNAELDKLKPPTGEKADQEFVTFVEKVENICRDMETVSCSEDLKNGHSW